MFFPVCKKIDHTLEHYNKIMFHTYNLLLLEKQNKAKYDAKLCGKSIHVYLKTKFHLDDYYANSIVKMAKGKLDSQLSLNKEYIKQKKEAISSIQEKLKEKEKLLQCFVETRENYHRYQKNRKLYRNGKLKELPKCKVKGITNLTIGENEVLVRFLHNGKIETVSYGIYEFEYQYLNPKIKHLKNLIGKYRHRISNLEQKIKNLEVIKPIMFGTQKKWREYNLTKDKAVKEEILFKKYDRFTISGRADGGYRNFIFKTTYDEVLDNFHINIRFLMANVSYLKVSGFHIAKRRSSNS